MAKNEIHACHGFDALIARAHNLGLPASFLYDVIANLNYLRAQSIADFDRRDKADRIRECWTNLENKTRGLRLFEPVRAKHDAWPAILKFVDVVDSKYVPKPEPKPRVESKDPYVSWSVETLLKDLLDRCNSMSVLPAEKRMLKLGLSYLKLEAERPRGRRNKEYIDEVWRIIWPLLHKNGVLEKYRASLVLKQKFVFFVRGGF